VNVAKASPPPPIQRGSPAGLLRGAIEAAEAAGVARAKMVLRLTLGDVIKLKRDASLAVADISFAGGVMRYLGVEVEQGGVAESVLDSSGIPRAAAPAAKAKPAKAPRKAAAKKATPKKTASKAAAPNADVAPTG
jgi:hypothetical protein